MARITGKTVSLEVAATEWKGEVRAWELTSAPKDNPTFADVEDGVADWQLKLTIEVDTGASSAWTYLTTNAGLAGVAVTLAPHGNATPSPTQPHFTLTATMPQAPGMGATASWASTPSTVDVVLDVASAPTKVTA